MELSNYYKKKDLDLSSDHRTQIHNEQGGGTQEGEYLMIREGRRTKRKRIPEMESF
jgi:hypothetical protein